MLLISLLLPLLATLTTAAPEQWDTSCQGTDLRLERLAEAVEHGDLGVVRAHLDSGGDLNETWRDSRSPMMCRSLLLRSIWYGQEQILQLLLQRGADPLSLPRGTLHMPVQNGRVEIARTLLARGLKPDDTDGIVRAGLESKNLAMLDLLVSSGVAINASNVPAYSLTDDITRFLVPTHLNANDEIGIGNEPCAVEKLFGLLTRNHDGCEWTMGPLWLHFVLTGRHAMVEFMIANGADLTMRSQVWDGGDFRPFTAMEVAAKRKDKRMTDLIRRAGRPAP
jgi:hypothetical protein